MPRTFSKTNSISMSPRATLARIPRPSNASREQVGQLGAGANQQHMDRVTMPELNLDETVRVREALGELIRGEYITNKFDLRVVLSELGIYPSDEELMLLLSAYENRISFNNLCNYLRFYKKKFQVLEQQWRGNSQTGPAQQESEDTLRAFVSLGGCEDGTGHVNIEDLRQACRSFGLTIDIDATLEGFIDTENQTTLSYLEFCYIWRSRAVSRGDLDPTISSYESTTDLRGRMGSVSPVREGPSRLLSASELASMCSSIQNAECRHLHALQRFLMPESHAGAMAAMDSPLRHTKELRQQLLPGLSSSALNDGDHLRHTIAARDDRGYDDGVLAMTSGGFRAPSPMILSLRNTPAYKQRMRAFAQKLRARSKAREGGGWKTNHQSARPDDDGGRG